MAKAGPIPDFERLSRFQHSCHDLYRTTYWPELRSQLRPDLVAQIEVQVNGDTGHVAMKDTPFDRRHIDLLFPRIRQFLSGGDSVYLDSVLPLVAESEITDPLFDEAVNVWAGVARKNVALLVRNGSSVGWEMPNAEVVWWEPNQLRSQAQSLDKMCVSLQDVTEVYMYEGHLHPKEPGRNETIRGAIRTMPELLLRGLADRAFTGTLYATLLVHDCIARYGLTKECPSDCQEWAIMQANREASEHASSGWV